MKKMLRFAGAAVLLIAVLLCGCGTTPPEKHEPIVYKPQYTVPSEVPAGTANDDKYKASAVQMREDSPLKDRTFYFLGSSVTYGASSEGEAMAEYLHALTGATCKKDAISGTTIFDDNKSADTGERSYTRRLTYSKVFDKNEHVDALICQISTNDARNDRLTKWGAMTDDEIVEKEHFDRTTSIGGVEYIIAYAIETWECPVYFYSGSYFGDSGTRSSTNPTGTNYGKLVDEVKKVAEKWTQLGYEVKVIDMFNDEDFNKTVSDDYYKWATSDAIHPRKAGYLEWWTPYFEAFLLNEFPL